MAGKGNPKKTKTIAPRLFDGEHREAIGHGLPPAIKDGLKSIARHENESVSWVLEKIIIEYFGFKQPKYIERKKKNETK